MSNAVRRVVVERRVPVGPGRFFWLKDMRYAMALFV